MRAYSHAVFTTLRTEVDGAVGHLTLGRPEKLNALNPQTLRELAQAAVWFDEQADVRVVVVRGEGRAFSAGFDLGSFAGDDDDSAVLGAAMATAVAAMRALTIAAIHGHCIGGGVVLAAACDLRIAADDASFSIPEVDLGIPLAWHGIPLLVRAIGPAATLDIVLTCRRFDAQEASALGFVQRVVPAAQLRPLADEFARQLAGKSALVLRQTKDQVAAALAGVAVDDAALLATALRDEESRAAALRYLEARGR
jgi:enoyl-CoA hydratase/carnithine racemase